MSLVSLQAGNDFGVVYIVNSYQIKVLTKFLM